MFSFNSPPWSALNLYNPFFWMHRVHEFNKNMYAAVQIADMHVKGQYVAGLVHSARHRGSRRS